MTEKELKIEHTARRLDRVQSYLRVLVGRYERTSNPKKKNQTVRPKNQKKIAQLLKEESELIEKYKLLTG